MNMRELNTLVVGSGAAGLAAACHLARKGVNFAVYSEGLRMGTSINTGSDKQTYYKLGMYGTAGDSVAQMARDLSSGGSMHGDLAMLEAALSPVTFSYLVNLGVPFPHDSFGAFIGYQTDHDTRCRASSTGPYTSRDMCLALIEELRRFKAEICGRRVLISLMIEVEDGVKHCKGGIFINLDAPVKDMVEFVYAKHTIFAVGGPGGLYAESVYPKCHNGAIGAALQIGAKARNLAESQFGLASTKFRWNVSGSYMQVLPRFVSVDADGKEYEFLREYFPTVEAMYEMIFLKGYQWPFAAGHLPGSSLVDVCVQREIVERRRKVYLDYRTDPADFDWLRLPDEARHYLEKSEARAATPVERLRRLNPQALELYRKHKIDLQQEMLEIAVCAQHNNGGLACDVNTESENIRNLYAIGEVNGSHGVTRPGGSALNAGQCGAFRVAEVIEARNRKSLAFEHGTIYFTEFFGRLNQPCMLDWREERTILQQRMSECGAFLRRSETVECALVESITQLQKHYHGGLHGLAAYDVAEYMRNEQLLAAQICYLGAILESVDSGAGSRGGAVVMTSDGQDVHPAFDWRIAPEDPAFREKVLETVFDENGLHSRWESCRPVPESEGWFENVWRDYQSGAVYERI